MNILVVDDSKIMRNILKNILKNENIPAESILEAPNGEDALVILEEKTIDLLLLDWNMPKLNGLELVKIVRKNDKYKELPIIMITSEAAKYNVIEAIKAGVTDYAVKPVSGTSVYAKIKEYLN